jgi:glucokinase
VNRAVNLGWGVLKAGPVLSELLGGIPVEVANDANAAALGEMWKGGGQGFHDVMMVTLGTGVGGGVILNGRIRTGAFGAAGEIGHMCMNPKETAVCGCGKKGCLEQYTSANGVARCAKKFLVENPKAKTTLRGIPNISSKDVFDGAKAGDYVCHQLVDEFGEMLGHGLANIASVIDPEIFVIGGGLSKAGQIVIDATKKFYLQYTFHASRETKFALASLGNDAGMYGCVKMVIDAAPDQVKEDPEE